LLLHRYHNIEYILQLDANTGAPLILKALEQNREERIFQQWVAQLPLMAYSGKYVSFADYKDRVTGANIDRRSTAEILAELDDVERELQEGGGTNGP
jgi:hypothetical protein